MKATYQTWKGSLLWSEVQAVLNTGKDLVVYDLETTGLSPQNDRIIEIAAVKYGVAPSDGDYVFTEKGVYHQLINPGVPLPQTITEITGLTDAALADKPLEADCVDEIALFFDGCILSGYNITTFDNGFMTEYFARFGHAFDAAYVVDGIKMARNRLRYKEDVENFKLATVGAYYGISFNAHSALEDTRTTSKLVQIFVHEYAGESKSDKPAAIGAMRPRIMQIAYWQGFKGFNRIYVNMDIGSVYYDIRSASWGAKDVDIRLLDMGWIEREAFRITGCGCESEFASFKGDIRVQPRR